MHIEQPCNCFHCNLATHTQHADPGMIFDVLGDQQIVTLSDAENKRHSIALCCKALLTLNKTAVSPAAFCAATQNQTQNMLLAIALPDMHDIIAIKLHSSIVFYRQ